MTDIKLFFLICSSQCILWDSSSHIFCRFTHRNARNKTTYYAHFKSNLLSHTFDDAAIFRGTIRASRYGIGIRVHKAKNDIRVTYKWKWFIKRCCLLTSCTFIIICLFNAVSFSSNKIMLLKSLCFEYNKEFYHDIIIKIMII